jgi:hypothetical protein
MEHKTSLTPRAQQMYTLVGKYLSSGSTQKQFCQQQSIPLSTFSYWLRHYRQNNQNPDQTSAEFIPLGLTSKRNVPVLSQPTCAVEYPNGVLVRLFGSVDVQLHGRLINLQEV